MKKLVPFVALSACVLVWPYLLHGQTNVCFQCKNHTCSNNLIGGCICSETVGGGCYTCGICSGGHCSFWCLAPSDKNPSPTDSPKQKSLKDRLNARITTEELATHPWLEDSSLSQQLAQFSPEMAQLIRIEQPTLKASFCPNFRRGSRLLDQADPSTEYTWEMIPRPGADEYRLTRSADGREVRLIMSDTEWILFSGDYSALLGKGDIAVSQRTQDKQ